MCVKKILFIFLFVVATIAATAENKDSLMIRKIYDEALTNGKSYGNLNYLCNKIGGRLSGSENAAKAVDYIESVLRTMNLETVYKQPCMVPQWVRGAKEEGKILLSSKTQQAPICALGGSIGTSEKGITAQVIEVKNFDELTSLGIEKNYFSFYFFNAK